MATTLENLTAARDGAAAKLAACLTDDYSSALEFKPGFNDSSSVDRATYLRELRETIEWLDRELSRHDVFEITSEMTA